MIFTQTVVISVGWPKIGRPMEDAMAELESLEKQIASVMKAFNAGEITHSQAKEKLQALILATETVGNLELAHRAYDSLDEGCSKEQ